MGVNYLKWVLCVIPPLHLYGCESVIPGVVSPNVYCEPIIYSLQSSSLITSYSCVLLPLPGMSQIIITATTTLFYLRKTK